MSVRGTVGNRGAILATLGVLWISYGVASWIQKPTHVQFFWFYNHTPWQLKVVAWFGTGAIAIANAFRKPGRDFIGWLFLFLMGFYGIVVYVDASLESIKDGAPAELIALTVLSGFRSVAFVFIIWVVSGWREPQPDDTDDPERDPVAQ